MRKVKLRPRERVTFEYVLLGGVTDQPKSRPGRSARLVRRTGLPAKVNLIAWNPGPGIEYAMPGRSGGEISRGAGGGGDSGVCAAATGARYLMRRAGS